MSLWHRSRKYSINLLEIGESVVLPWESEDKAEIFVERMRMARCIDQERRVFGKKFKTRARPDGLWVIRLK